MIKTALVIIMCACIPLDSYAAIFCLKNPHENLWVCKDIEEDHLKVISQDENTGTMVIQNTQTKQKLSVSPKIIFEPIKLLD